MKNVNLRLDDELHARIKTAAEDQDRSLQQQLIHLLKLGLLYGALSPDPPKAAKAAINRFYREPQ